MASEPFDDASLPRASDHPTGSRHLYVYAIAPGPLPDIEGSPGSGIDGAEVTTVRTPSGLLAFVHETDAGPYQGADDDVRRWIVEHSQVVERVWDAAGTVLPVTFNVLVSGEESPARQRLEEWLHDTEHEMRARLAALRDRVELRLEIGLDRTVAAAHDPEVARLEADAANKAAGVRRLLEKKLDRLRRDAADALADRLYPDVRRRVVALVEDLVEIRTTTARDGEVAVLSVAVLTHRDRVEELGAELARIQAEQPAARIRFLGPWPPYSFAELATAPPTDARNRD